VHLARLVEYDVPDRDGNGTGELIVLLTTISPRHHLLVARNLNDPSDQACFYCYTPRVDRWVKLVRHRFGSGVTHRDFPAGRGCR
jgi:hypothetical protein